MDINEFSNRQNLLSKTEIEKVFYLAFYYLRLNSQEEFDLDDVKRWFSMLNLPAPNITRLGKKLSASSDFIRGKRVKSYRLHAKRIKELQELLPDIAYKSTEVTSDGEILPNSLLDGKRQYIQQFGKQINSTYRNNIFDGCAVLMRRMVEICLIHVYENLGIDNQIKIGPDKFKDLKEIIKDAVSNSAVNLTKDSKDCLDEFRELGNLSAHRLYYNCKSEEINNVKKEFRLLVEELFNKAGKKVEK
jgi:hypothetical protein